MSNNIKYQGYNTKECGYVWLQKWPGLGVGSSDGATNDRILDWHDSSDSATSDHILDWHDGMAW